MTIELNMTRAILDRIHELDARDESQIMAELAGETVNEMFYIAEVFDRKTKQAIKKPKLSWAGTKEAARSRGNIVVDENPIIAELEDGVRIVVRVTDLTRNFTIFGGCHQPKKMKINEVDPATKQVIGHRYEDDPYYFQKGLSKAQRNGIQTILPADFIAKCLDRFIKISERPQIKAGRDATQLKTPTKAQLKETASWESITQEMVPDYNTLERVFWDITKKQPAEMYKELGGKSRIELNTTAWESFLALRQLFSITTTERG